jgi:predicted transcriptional regulator
LIRRRVARSGVLVKRPRGAGGVPLSPTEIRDLRGTRTRKAFARQLGVSLATVYLWDAGRMRPSADNLARLRRLFGRARAIGSRAKIAIRRRSGTRIARS